MERKAILNEIKSKGGLYGIAVDMYINDDEKADQFIRECAEQCHNKLALVMWGEELVSDILKYIGNSNKEFKNHSQEQGLNFHYNRTSTQNSQH
jgi:hypothetical protein